MKISALIICTIGATAVAPSSAFLSLINKVNPSLTKYAEAQEDAMLKIHLDIGQVEMKDGKPLITGNRLGIDNLLLQLRGKESASPKHASLPGADGPNPQLSSGPKSLVVVNQGSYVDLAGTQRVNLEDGAWEMIWRSNARAGALICAFNLAEEVKRNDAAIPKGRFFLTFPLWTSESLQDLRDRKAKAEEKATEAIERHASEVRMMQETNNPLMKALHFRNACKAHEDLDYSGYRSYQKMPLERDMIHLEGNLHLCSLGTIWTKKEGWFADHELLGSARAFQDDLAKVTGVADKKISNLHP